MSSTQPVALKKLAGYKQLIDEDVAQYSRQLLDDWAGAYTDYSRESMQAYCDILLRGGKRLRGALVMTAYEMVGGTDQKMILQAARAIELMHAYVLVIDDIADHADKRRGGPSAHRMIEHYHARHKLKGASAQFGASIAMHIGLAGCHLAMAELGQLSVDDAVKVRALNTLNEHMLTTINGQFNDLFNEALQDVKEEQVMSVLNWKTSYYSFLNPLQLGMILGRADPTEYPCLREYSINAGLSFQLIDDILGTFGDELESGKSAKDDLKEGKITLLVARALSRADDSQKSRLLLTLGHADLSAADYEECKNIIRDTGAFDHVNQLARQYAAKAAAALDDAPAGWRQENVQFLQGLAMYITSRNV
jgi:geranylgeranyl diphosphate synthase, type I